MALKNGKEYLENKITYKKTKRTRNKKDYFVSEKMIQDIEYFLKNLNKRSNLHRTQSLNNIKFPRRKPLEPEFEKPKYLKCTKRQSLSNLIGFETFIQKNSHNLNDSSNTELNEREKVRKIWNIWFDEVIPPLENSPLNNLKNEEDLEFSQLNKQILDNQLDKSLDKTHETSTPYELFYQVELPFTKKELSIVKEIEDEIFELTIKIENNQNVFFLVKRAVLYKKVFYCHYLIEKS